MLALLSLLACGLIEGADPSPAPDPTAASTATPAPSTAAPAPVPAAPDSAAPDPAATSPAPLASAEKPGHCAQGQHVWFQCAVGQGRAVSLCGDGAPTWLQYHFGPPGAPALTVPAAPAGLERFGWASQAWVQAQADAVRFENEGVTYLLVDKRGAGGPDGEANNFQGVVVRKGDQEVQRFPCVGLLEAEGMPSLAGRLAALGYEG